MIDWKLLGLFGMVVSQIAGSVIAGMGLAHLLVLKANAPTLVYGVGAMLGLANAFYQIMRITKKVREK